MASSIRTTQVTHPDGTVSTRKSKTRDYYWAIEVKTDEHAVARDKHQTVQEVERSQESLERAIAGGQWRTEPHDFGQGTTTYFYLVDPVTGNEHWIGSDRHGAEWAADQELDKLAAIAKQRAELVGRRARVLDEAAKLEAGPQYSYGVMRWSERKESADQALGQFAGMKHKTFTVVQAVEQGVRPVKSRKEASKPKTPVEMARAANAAALAALRDA